MNVLQKIEKAESPRKKAALPRAPRTGSAGPPLRWVGGKTALLPHILPLVPETFRRYHEPFVGGGALYWALANAGKLDGPKMIARLGDTNVQLVRMFWALQENVEDVIAELAKLPHDKDFYNEFRRSPFARSRVNAEAAAWVLYLSRLSYNGLWRVNKKGELNTPWGKRLKTSVYDPATLRACAEVLRRVKTEIVQGSFLTALEAVGKDDLVFVDPPYIGAESFSSYTSAGPFTMELHEKLRNSLVNLKERGAHVIACNSDTPATRALYTQELGFTLREVTKFRSVGANASRRGRVTELLIT